MIRMDIDLIYLPVKSERMRGGEEADRKEMKTRRETKCLNRVVQGRAGMEMKHAPFTSFAIGKVQPKLQSRKPQCFR